MTAPPIQKLCLYAGAEWTILLPRIAPADATTATWHLYKRNTTSPRILTADAVINADSRAVTVTLSPTTTTTIKAGVYDLFIKAGDDHRQIAYAQVTTLAVPADVRDAADLPPPTDGGGGTTQPRFSVYSGATASDVIPALPLLTETETTRAGTTLTIETIEGGTMWIVVPATRPLAAILNGDFAGDNILLRSRDQTEDIGGVQYRVYSVANTGQFTVHAVISFT